MGRAWARQGVVADGTREGLGQGQGLGRGGRGLGRGLGTVGGTWAWQAGPGHSRVRAAGGAGAWWAGHGAALRCCGWGLGMVGAWASGKVLEATLWARLPANTRSAMVVRASGLPRQPCVQLEQEAHGGSDRA